MLEVLLLVLTLVFLVVFLVSYSGIKDQLELAYLERRISSLKTQIDLTEKKFLQRKIPKDTYEFLSEKFQSELMNCEFEVFKLREGKNISVEGKVAQLLQKIKSPSNRQKARINALTKDVEYLKSEIKILKEKLMKHQINPSVYSKLVAEKEAMLIQKEAEISQLISNS